jgi:hypothetical protein
MKQLGALFNPLLSLPEDFDIELTGGQQLVRVKNSTVNAKFCTVGLLQAFTVDETGSSFQISPVNMAWGKTTAFFGALFKESALYFTTYKKGLNFSTRKKKGG